MECPRCRTPLIARFGLPRPCKCARTTITVQPFSLTITVSKAELEAASGLQPAYMRMMGWW